MTHIRRIPVLPLKDLVIFPHSLHTLHVGSVTATKALYLAWLTDKKVLICTRHSTAEDHSLPNPDDLHSFGCLASVLQMSPHGGVIRVMVEGRQRAQAASMEICDAHDYVVTKGISLDDAVRSVELEELFQLSGGRNPIEVGDQALVADIDLMEEITPPYLHDDPLLKELITGFRDYSERSKQFAEKVKEQLAGNQRPAYLVDRVATHMEMSSEDKQNALEILNVEDRASYLNVVVKAALEAAETENAVHNRVKQQIHKNQREYYLNEQMKAIRKELGHPDDSDEDDMTVLAERIAGSGMPQEALDKANKELGKLKGMAPIAAEASVIRSYIDWLVSLPWKKLSRNRLDILKAEEILDEEHYGLSEIKDRILEHLAVQRRTKKITGPVLCLVGPPGVGKTSLAKSIAKAIDAKFTRIALGGVRDEAEIRGHRRTYIGAMPGKILQKMSKVGVRNPLFLLDEVDKMGMDFRGDPAAALLEVLDSEQNYAFGDHYLEIDYDLSQVLFICTANSMKIPPALLDRLEVIRLPGYTENEKFNIASKHLLPRQIKANGLRKGELEVTDDALWEIIRYYTKEAGVRGLEGELNKLCRKAIHNQMKAPTDQTIKITENDVKDYNGIRIYRHLKTGKKDQAGHVFGLAWTEAGGEMLDIEAAIVPGSGKHKSTGCLGDVMQESIHAALTYIRKKAISLGLPEDFYSHYDVHVHIPEGAIPKDGPSAGIGICTAMISAFTGIPVCHDVAMTGEINLRGQVLPVGGLKEKLIAAHRGCIKKVIIPEENTRNLQDILDEVISDLEIFTVSEMSEVLDISLIYQPGPLVASVIGEGIATEKIT